MFTGIVTVVICAILSYIAWRLGKQERYFWALLMLLLAGLFLRLFVASDPFLHMWDERYHALVAKNLMQHPLVPMLYDRPILNFNDFNWVDSHIWLHKQPVPLWGISASLYCFGVNDFAVRFPSILISSLGILLMNDLARRMFNRKVGLYAAFFYAINGWVLEMVSGRTPTDHVDVFFAFFILLAVVLAYRFAENRLFWWNILTGAAIGLAILSKWLPALIVVPIWLCFLLHFKFKIQQILLHGVVLFAVIGAVVLPWQLYIYSQFPMEAAFESAYNVRHVFEVLEGQVRLFYFYLDVMRVSYGELIYIPLIWFAVMAFRLKRDFRYWAIVLWIAIPSVFFSFVATKMQSYTFFTAPALFLVTSVFLDELIQARIVKIPWLRWTLVVLLVGLPARYTIERLKPFRDSVSVPIWKDSMTKFSKSISNSEEVIVFNTEHAIEFMFYTDVVAYDNLPSEKTLDSLEDVGFKLYCVQNDTVAKLRDILPD